MKRFFVFTFVVLFIIAFNISMGAYYVKDTNMEILRVQIVAASDSDFDQYVKYEVSSVADSYISELFETCEVSELSEAVEVLKNNIGRIRAVCVDTARRVGCFDPIFIGVFEVGKEKYNSAAVLNDEGYPLLRIEIGKGKGHNCQKIVWSQGASIEKKVSENLTIARSVFPAEVKLNFWIVGVLKNFISSFE